MEKSKLTEIKINYNIYKIEICWEFFCGEWSGSVTNIIEHGRYTHYEKSCILEIEN